MIDEFYSPEEAAKIESLKADGISVLWLSGLCPVQSQGLIDGHPYYWRARGDEWSVQIAHEKSFNVEDAITLDMSKIWVYREEYGVVPDAGYMPFIEALQFIEKAVNKWRGK